MNCLKTTTTVVEDENVTKKIQEVFKGALRSSEFASRIKSVLNKNGYDDKKTLLATSLCCDEVNRELEGDLTSVYNFNFSMGGLAGFAFGGATSFGAMAHHIPDNGDCLVVYGPHVGVDKDGAVGKVNRRGRNGSGACCGSAAAAAGYCKDVQGGAEPTPPATDVLDAQQTFVNNLLLPQADRLSSSSNADVELPLALFDVQNELMHRIVEKMHAEVGGDGKIAILGGIQINTPAGTSEYFLPKVFKLMNNKGEEISDLLSQL
jgi:hypothetical protein